MQRRRTRNYLPPFPDQIGRALSLVGWNVLLVILGLILIGVVGEVWLRSTMPFLISRYPKRFDPDVGLLGKPNTEVRWTNALDFWTVTQTNSLGFLDREPISPERAAASCHIVMIGDSFVEAKAVSLVDKFHIRLETLASHHLPHQNITSSAFGFGGSGPINQLAYYDKFASHLHAKLLVLEPGDFQDNSPILSTVRRNHPPELRASPHGRKG